LGGVFQPFADAIKLFTKEETVPRKSNRRVFMLAPAGAIFLRIRGWAIAPTERREADYSLVVFILILGLGLYPLLLAGWASNSSYALVGGIRGVAQTISYEIRLALILIRVFRSVNRLALSSLKVALCT